ncbi:MAG TPA: hypothetical protein VLE69_00160 [Candidatus Saccharimonadales bacterium]|nr:hypothetical protein [Candidatus Saccharimonadales bacterium]
MSKSLNIKSLISKATLLLQQMRQYLPLIFIVVLLGLYGFLVFQINSVTSAEPTDDAVTEKLQTVQRPKIDQSTVDKLQQLQDNSTEVQTLFKETRDNPFQE